MAKPMHETHQLRFGGAVDADGHILEPPDLWETYLEPQFRDRALRIVRDDAKLEALEIGGRPSVMSRKGFPSTLGAMGDPDLHSMRFDPERTYVGEAPYGSMDPDERLEGARRRGHRRRRAVHDGRPAVGGRARRSRSLAGVHARVQPVDLRVLRGERPSRARPRICR